MKSSKSDDSDSVFDEYYLNAKPHEKVDNLVLKLHQNLFYTVQKQIGNLVGKRVLEVGVGHGHFAKVATKHGMKWFGVEINAKLSQKLIDEGFDVQIGKFPVRSKFDKINMIWMAHVLEHVTGWEQALGFAKSSYENLDKNGHLVIIAPDILSWKFLFFDAHWTHQFPTSLRRVQQLLVEGNFKEIKTLHIRGGRTNILYRMFYATISFLVPTKIVDFFFMLFFNKRFVDSWLQNFGRRQILVIGKKL